MKPFISVIIPTFNRAYCLLRSINSVLNQKYKNFELIVVDDGSTDETKSLVQRFNGRQVRYLHQNNKGPASARNLGVSQAAGDFIAFLDSDDEWLPGKLEAQIDFFCEFHDMLICQTNEIWIRNGKRVNPMKKHAKFGGDIFDKCLPLCIVSPSAVMMRKSFFEQVGLFDETFPACEDYDLWLRASAKLPFGLIDKSFVVKYGGHSDQTSRKYEKMDEFRVRAIARLIDSNSLTSEQRSLAIDELARKCTILENGAVKRGLEKDVQNFRSILSQYKYKQDTGKI